MKRIAIIGGGISGMSAAYYLSRKHEVWLFEKEDRIGGHTHTVTVDGSAGPLAIDTGFIVHNDRTYPNLVKLFAELGVRTAPSDMSFAVRNPESGFEYSSRGLNGFFAQRRLLLSAAHYRLLGEIMRFNREAPRLLDQPDADSLTMGAFLREGRFQDSFIDRYLYPMASAVWSMPPDSMDAFPAPTLIRFFENHGMLGINTHPKWKVVSGGSNQYIAPLTKPYRERIRSGVEIESVSRDEAGVAIVVRGEVSRFDEVVFACHGNQILPLLADASDTERDVLGAFETSINDVCLHTDASLLPAREQARASWNYQLTTGKAATLTYHMNRLQSLPGKEDYCVSLNANGSIRPEKILRRMTYAHPIYSLAAIRAQKRWAEISGARHTHFCGAYWFYGFHEDGLNSALRVAKDLGVE